MVVDPVNGNFVDPQATAFCHHEKLRVEEPSVVLDERDQLARSLGPESFEAALRVRKVVAQGRSQDEVVHPRDELALWSPYHSRTWRKPRTDSHVAVACEERGHERQEGVEIGREVDIHICDDRSAALEPCLSQRAAPAFLLEVERTHAVELFG